MTLARTNRDRHAEPFPTPLPLPEAKVDRLLAGGIALSRNDRTIILYGQLLTTLTVARDAESFATIVDTDLNRADRPVPRRRATSQQQVLFEQA